KTNNFSVELWLRRTKAGLQAVAGKPLSATTASENYAFWLDAASKLRFEVGNGTTSASVSTPAAIDTAWHHAVGTFASGQLRLYVDGALAASTTATFTTAKVNGSQL